MKKRILLTAIITVVIFGLLPGVALGGGGFSVTPTHLEATVTGDEASPLYIYITSYSDGELIVGTEDIPFRIEPESIPVSSTDENRKVELLVYGDPSLEEGEYSGRLTLLAYSGTNVAYGIKIDTVITQRHRHTLGSLVEESVDTVERNYIVIAAVAAGVVAALVLGILIGRKSRGSPGKHPSRPGNNSAGEDE